MQTPTEAPFRQPRKDFYLAGAVALLAAIIYLLTVQRTVSFWDCGEFIASAVIMGVPHPPGSPFYLLLGKMFSMIPFGDGQG